MIDLAIALVLQLGILCALARRLPPAVDRDEKPCTGRGVTGSPASGLEAAGRMVERAYGLQDAGIADPTTGEFDA
jgi:hypothetical protein